jgi:hypothetical protein
MDMNYILRTIVGSYNPSDAINLPFNEQRQIIKEITGFTVTDPEVALRYLESGDLGDLVDDRAVSNVLRNQLHDQGYILLSDDDLRAYLLTQNIAILAREEVNWSVLEEEYGRERFLELLLQAGSQQALEHFEHVVGRELDYAEAETVYRAALNLHDFDTLRYIEELDMGVPNTNTSTPEGIATILNLTDDEVRLLVEYETEDGNDITVFFPETYYREGAVDKFLFYMNLLDERDRIFAMGNLVGFINGPLEEFDVNNPIVQAYLEHFPEDHAAKELIIGGVQSLKQTVYPEPYSQYTLGRGELYQAEQELAYYDQITNGQLRGDPEQIERLKQRVQYLKSLA